MATSLAPTQKLPDFGLAGSAALLRAPASKNNMFLFAREQQSSPTSNRLYSVSFVKTSILGGLPSSGTAVLTDFMKKAKNKHSASKDSNTVFS